MSLGYRPLVYMWIAEYSDGSALPQFDPETGRENKGDPDWLSSGKETMQVGQTRLHVDFGFKDERPKFFREKKLCRFGWYPFSVEMMGKILNGEGIAVIPTNNSFYSIELTEGQALIAKRTTVVAVFKYRECEMCGHQWQQKNAPPSEMIDFPTSYEFYVENIKAGNRIVKFSSPICPNCGYHDTNAVMMADKRIRRYASEVRKTFYMLGVEGGEIRRIGEKGEVIDG